MKNPLIINNLSGGAGFIEQPNVSLVDENNSIYYTPVTPVPNNEIWYISTDGNIVTPNEQAKFTNANGTELSIISNEYKNGRGVIKFDGELYSLGRRSFYQVTNLCRISLPDSIVELNPSAFNNTGLLYFDFPPKVSVITMSVVADNYNMISINLPDIATKIEDMLYGD